MSAMRKLSIKDEPEVFKGKRVLVRVDYNVVEKGEIKDTYRIDATLPTVEFLLNSGAKVVLASHAGRPKGRDEDLSLRPVASYLAKKLQKDVHFHEDVYTDLQTQADVVLLENLRFWKGEAEDDKEFAKKLAGFGEIYVNDAFAVSHRKNASVHSIAEFYDKRYAGLLMTKELSELGRLKEEPEKPFHVLLGGAKVKDKIPLIEALSQKADFILIGGAMAYTFLKAKGKSVGKSLVDEESLGWAQEFLKEMGDKLILPKDHVVADSEVKECGSGYNVKDILEEDIPEGLIGYDIGWNTVMEFRKRLKEAKTVFWNGPLGLYECDDFECGTKLIAIYLSELKQDGKKVVVGGGDTVDAIRRFDISTQDFHFVSTGGGATLTFLAGGDMPGVDILTDVHS